MKKYILLVFFLSYSVFTAYTQVFKQPGFKPKRNLFREYVLAPLHFNIESGYGLGFQSQTIDYSENSRGTGSNSSITRSVPVAFSVHYKYKNYKLGVYYGYHFVTTDSYQLNSANPNFISTDVTNTVFAGYFGYQLDLLKYWSHTPEIRIGSRTYKETGIDTSGITVDLGVNIEHHLSEILRLRIRPSMEFVSYSSSGGLGSLDTSSPTYHITLGISFNVAKLARCRLPNCASTINHIHPLYFNKEFRSNRHNVFIEQNPMYGEHTRKRWDIVDLLFRKNKKFTPIEELKDSNFVTNILNLVKRKPNEDKKKKGKEKKGEKDSEETDEESKEESKEENNPSEEIKEDNAPSEDNPDNKDSEKSE